MLGEPIAARPLSATPRPDLRRVTQTRAEHSPADRRVMVAQKP